MRSVFDGTGQWAVTFDCENVQCGQVVKLCGNREVAPCESGEDFCGVVVSAGRDGRACAVVLGGLASCAFSGAAPELGMVKLSADGQGGVQSGAGREFLVVDVDQEGKWVCFRL